MVLKLCLECFGSISLCVRLRTRCYTTCLNNAMRWVDRGGMLLLTTATYLSLPAAVDACWDAAGSVGWMPESIELCVHLCIRCHPLPPLRPHLPQRHFCHTNSHV